LGITWGNPINHFERPLLAESSHLSKPNNNPKRTFNNFFLFSFISILGSLI